MKTALGPALNLQVGELRKEAVLVERTYPLNFLAPILDVRVLAKNNFLSGYFGTFTLVHVS